MPRILPLAILLATAATTVAVAGAQSSTFDLQLNNKTIGKDTFTLAKSKQGYKLSSRFGYHTPAGEVDTSDDFKYSDDYVYQDGGASSIATQMRNSYTPNKARTQLTIGMVQAGVQDSRQLVIKPDFVLLPNYDAGAAQAFLMEALLHPVATNLYNIVVPSSGSGAQRTGENRDQDPAQMQARAAQAGNMAYDALFAKGPAATGTLDGKPVTLQTGTLTAGNFTWTFYAAEDNTLMQVDVSLAHASYVRTKFKLDPK